MVHENISISTFDRASILGIGLISFYLLFATVSIQYSYRCTTCLKLKLTTDYYIHNHGPLTYSVKTTPYHKFFKLQLSLEKMASKHTHTYILDGSTSRQFGSSGGHSGSVYSDKFYAIGFLRNFIKYVDDKTVKENFKVIIHPSIIRKLDWKLDQLGFKFNGYDTEIDFYSWMTLNSNKMKLDYQFSHFNNLEKSYGKTILKSNVLKFNKLLKKISVNTASNDTI